MFPYLIWPVLVTAFVAVLATVAHAGPAGIAIGAVSVVGVILVVEQIRPSMTHESVLKDPEAFHDIGHALLANGIAQITDAGAIATGALVAGVLAKASPLHLWPVHWPPVVQGILTVVIADGLEYWRHRWVHRVSWLWPIHALHHGADRLHVLKGGRNTFLDMMSRSLVVFGPLAAAGVPIPMLLWYPCAILVLGPISHANIDLRVPALLHRVLVTPAEHRLHHARDLALADGNFAIVTPLWDIAFGTFHDPASRTAPAVGCDPDPIGSGFVQQALSPFLWRRLSRSRMHVRSRRTSR